MSVLRTLSRLAATALELLALFIFRVGVLSAFLIGAYIAFVRMNIPGLMNLLSDFRLGVFFTLATCVTILFLLNGRYMSTPSRVRGLPLQVRRADDGRRVLSRYLVACVGPRHSQHQAEACETVSIPEGFLTDYSSIPWFARWVVDWSKVDVAGVVHDYLYSDQCTYPHDRWASDVIWWRLARSGKRRANVVQASVCWLAMRLAGWYWFKRRT